jgi:phosphoglycolate phosphatase-like HAD superfamily hydrolase
VLAAGNTLDIVRAWFPGLDGRAFAAMVARIDAAFHANGLSHSVPVTGLVETLAILTGRDLALGVATSDGTAATRAALAMLGVSPYLPHVFGYDSVPRPKPAPDMVHAFAAATGLDPGEIAVVGDNVHDLHMARAAGAGAAIGVLTGNAQAEDLAPLGRRGPAQHPRPAGLARPPRPRPGECAAPLRRCMPQVAAEPSDGPSIVITDQPFRMASQTRAREETVTR